MQRFLYQLPNRPRHFSPSPELLADLHWWQHFLLACHGVSFLRSSPWIDEISHFCTEASLAGIGGFLYGHFFHSTFPPFIAVTSVSIASLEMLAVTVSFKLWSQELQGQRIFVRTDNRTTELAINTGCSHLPFIQSCLRELWFYASLCDFELCALVISSLFRLSGFHLRDLQHRVWQIQAFTLSSATKWNYQSIWNTYLQFCHFYCLPQFPTAPATIATFVTLVSFSIKPHHTINNYLTPCDGSAFFLLFRHKGFWRHLHHTDCQRFGKVYGPHPLSQSSTHTIHPAPIQRPSRPSWLRSPCLVVCLSDRLLHILSHSKFGSSFTWYLLLTQHTFQKQHYIQQFRRPYYYYKNKNLQSRWYFPCCSCPARSWIPTFTTFALHSSLWSVPAPGTHPLFSFLSTLHQLALASLPRALMMVSNTWLPSSLWTPGTTKGKVCIAAVLHSPFS